MQFKTIIATAAVALSLGSFAQSAHAQIRPSGSPSSNARIESMMRSIDRFQSRQHQAERKYYYAERQRQQSDSYAARMAYPRR